MLKNNFPIKNHQHFICPLEKYKQITNISRILNAQYAMHVSFLSAANFLVTRFVTSERALLGKYE